MHRGERRPTPPSAPVTTRAALLPAWTTQGRSAGGAFEVCRCASRSPLPPAPEPSDHEVSYAPSRQHPRPAGARHSEITANLLIGMGLNFRCFSERALIEHATRSDLQSAPFATRDTPPERAYLRHPNELSNSRVIVRSVIPNTAQRFVLNACSRGVRGRHHIGIALPGAGTAADYTGSAVIERRRGIEMGAVSEAAVRRATIAGLCCG
jgi:hypothetical protein